MVTCTFRGIYYQQKYTFNRLINEKLPWVVLVYTHTEGFHYGSIYLQKYLLPILFPRTTVLASNLVGHLLPAVWVLANL